MQETPVIAILTVGSSIYTCSFIYTCMCALALLFFIIC